MEDLAYIKQALEELVTEIDTHPLGTEDMRKSHLELTLFIFNAYYIQWNSIQTARIIQRKKFPATPEEIEILRIFANSISGDGYHTRIRTSYRSLILDSWSTFEFCLTYLCASLFNEEIINGLLNEEFNKIDKIISKHDFTDDERRKILKAYTKTHLTHLSVNRKYEKIYSLFKKSYSGIWLEDQKFLEFFGKYRNCMHANFIYHGTDTEYTITGITYKFTNGEPISQTVEADINNVFNLALELKNVCRRLFDAIEYPGLIPYPSDKVPQPQ